MSNILATLHPYSNIPPGSVYRGDGKFDILEPTPFTTVNVKRKDVNDSGTATFTAPGETIKTRLELRKLALAEYRAQKQKAAKAKRDEVIAARYLDLTTRIATAQAAKATTEGDIATLNALIITLTAELAGYETTVATRATALATAQAALAAAVGQAQIDARTAALATRQAQYDSAVNARNAAQDRLTTRQGDLATKQQALVTRTDNLTRIQTAFDAFKLKRGIA